MKPLDRIIDAARKAPRHVVLPEGEDPRIVAGAVQARREGLAAITLVGNREVITQRLTALDAIPQEFRIEDRRALRLPMILRPPISNAEGAKVSMRPRLGRPSFHR